MDPMPDTDAEEACRTLRPGLALAVTWRVLTELWRRHHTTHNLRLLETHPGVSERGQLCLLVNPRPGQVMDCPRLVLNLGGPTGTFQVLASGQVQAEGRYLWPFLTENPVLVVDRLERHLGLNAPPSLPASTPQVLMMRLIAELLSAACLDRDGLGVETAWMDWSGGVSVRPWAAYFGHDVRSLQSGLDSGQIEWQAAYLNVSGLLRLAPIQDEHPPTTECLMDLHSSKVLMIQRGKTLETVDVPRAYLQANRRLEPLAARLIVALRGEK